MELLPLWREKEEVFQFMHWPSVGIRLLIGVAELAC